MFVTVGANDKNHTAKKIKKIKIKKKEGADSSPPLAATHANMPESTMTYTTSEEEGGGVEGCKCLLSLSLALRTHGKDTEKPL